MNGQKTPRGNFGKINGSHLFVLIYPLKITSKKLLTLGLLGGHPSKVKKRVHCHFQLQKIGLT